MSWQVGILVVAVGSMRAHVLGLGSWFYLGILTHVPDTAGGDSGWEQRCPRDGAMGRRLRGGVPLDR